MAAGFDLIEAVLVGILSIVLAVAILFPLCSAQPDPKMRLLLCLLDNLPRAEDETAGPTQVHHESVGNCSDGTA